MHARNYDTNMPKQNENLAVVLHGKNDLRVEKWPMPKPKPHEVLLKIGSVGICGSDIHMWEDGRNGKIPLMAPLVTGHEGSGTVIELGSEVKNLKIGDRVAIEPGVPCRSCTFCRVGEYNVCPNIVFCSSPPYGGVLCRYYVHNADYLYKLPDHVSLVEGALVQPLSIAVHACKRGKITAESKVLILGAGPIGLNILLTAKAFGATKIMLTDIVDFRLQKAKEFGADLVYKINVNDNEETTTKNILEAFGEEPTTTFECSGVQSSARIAILASKKKGTVVLVGLGKLDQTFPAFDIVFKELDVLGCIRISNDYPTALNLVASGRINLLQTVSHNFTLEEAVKAYTTAKENPMTALKVVIHANDN